MRVLRGRLVRPFYGYLASKDAEVHASLLASSTLHTASWLPTHRPVVVAATGTLLPLLLAMPLLLLLLMSRPKLTKPLLNMTLLRQPTDKLLDLHWYAATPRWSSLKPHLRLALHSKVYVQGERSLTTNHQRTTTRACGSGFPGSKCQRIWKRSSPHYSFP